MSAASTPVSTMDNRLPRVTIQFCTQCKWMLRAAYYAQELLSTFSTALGEVALIPSTGGTFIVTIYHAPAGDNQQENEEQQQQQQQQQQVLSRTLWDRKVDGGFPETKELKRRVRDVIEPGRDLGHVDRDHGKKAPETEYADAQGSGAQEKTQTDKDTDQPQQVLAGEQKTKDRCEDCQ